MVEPLAQRVRKRHDARHDAIDEHVHVDRETRFQLAEPEHGFHHHHGIDIARARLDHEANVLRGLVAHIGDERQLLVVHEFGELLVKPAFLHAVGNFRDDDDPGSPARVLLRPAGAQAERAAPRAIGLGYLLGRVDDDAAGGEIRPLHEGHELVARRLGMGDEIERGVEQFGQIMRRDRRRHAHRDALRAIGEQVGEGRGQHDGLALIAGVIVAEVDRVLVDAVEQQARDLGHAGLGVAIGGGGIAVDIAEVALPVDHRIARGKILREAHQRIIDRLIAMRVKRAHHVADDLGALLEHRIRTEPQDVHAVQDAAMNRLQAVARVRQGAAHDRGQRIGEIALLERVAQIDRLRHGRRRGIRGCLGHGRGVAKGSGRGKFSFWTFPDPSPNEAVDCCCIALARRPAAPYPLARGVAMCVGAWPGEAKTVTFLVTKHALKRQRFW